MERQVLDDQNQDLYFPFLPVGIIIAVCLLGLAIIYFVKDSYGS